MKIERETETETRNTDWPQKSVGHLWPQSLFLAVYKQNLLSGTARTPLANILT